MAAPSGRLRSILPLGCLLVGVIGELYPLYALGHAAIAGAANSFAKTFWSVGLLVVALMVLLVLMQRGSGKPPGTGSPALERTLLRPYLVFAAIAIGVLLGGYALYRQQAQDVMRRAEDSLANLTELTARQLEAELRDFRVDLEYAGRNPLLAHAILNRRKTDSDTGRPDMHGGLEVLRQSEGFHRLQVFGSDGQPIGDAGGSIQLTERLRFWIRGAELTGRVVMSDLYVPEDTVNGHPVIDFVVSIMDDDAPNKVAGVLVARVDPDESIFPELAHRRNVSLQGIRFAIAHRRNEAVAVLLPPEQRSAGEIERLTVETDSAPVAVVRGQQGVFTATDEEGQALIAIGRPIQETPWYIVGTVSQDAVLASLLRIAHIALLLATVALLFSGWMVNRWWRGERLAMAAKVSAAERRADLLKEHFAIAGRFVHDIVLLLDESDGRIVEANERALHAYGYERAELLSRTVMQLRPDGSTEQREAAERFARVHETGGSTYLTRHWRKDGSSFPVEATIRPCELDGRRFVQMVGRDITERVEQEERLAQVSAERDSVLERMRRQFDQMAAACVVLAADGTVLQSNPAVERAFGFRADQILGRNVHHFVKSAVFIGQIDRWMDQLRHDPDAKLVGVFENIAGDGRTIMCRWNATALRGEDGGFAGMIGMAEDITEQVQAERALRNSEERYRTLTQISPVGIYRTDLDGLTVFVNARCCEIVGLDAHECLGLGWVRTIHPDDIGTTSLAWKAYIDSRGSVPYMPEFRVIRPDGSVAWVLALVTPERDMHGQVQGHVGTITDITALKLAQLELSEARDHLEERVAERTVELEQAKNAAEHSDRVKTAFLSTVSHELRTPLNSILGFTDVLLQGLSGPLNDDQQRQLRIVRDSSAHLRSLIEDVLDISRIEAGQVGLEFADVDLYDVVSRRVEAFGPEFARKKLRLQVDVEGTLPGIRSDRKRTAQIVNNLLSNALKFTDHGGVTVRLRTLADRVEMQVIDTGIGIPTSAQSQLFNPFMQVARPGGRMHEGTGLGLAISRNLARALGGDISVASEVGRGSRFVFWLPLVTHEYDAASTSATFRKADTARAVGAV